MQDQTIYSLKAIVEQQETVFDEKVKILTAKYDQVKTINMVLQVSAYLNTIMWVVWGYWSISLFVHWWKKRLMLALTKESGKS